MASTRRRYQTYSEQQPIGSNGRPACLVCKGDITEPRRKTFCREQCRETHDIRTNPGVVRRKVLIRDRGVCAGCGRNVFVGTPYEHMTLQRLVIVRTGHLWQADHVVEVVEGGGECELDNYQTLCSPCHKVKTAALAARRAQQRRLLKSASGGDV